MAYQSLYRRYRPRRFGDVRGQDHVVRALRNAARDGTVAHAYLFSGPRGTGKTSTARILAKALNCEAPTDGEPCSACEPCLAVEAGTSLVVNELDAASNRGVDAMRDLIGRVALGTAGRTKLYILDEVHMLTADAANTLLKTLEEPPGHVVFVLATTEPERVPPTIRSRTQHFDFHLLPATTLTDHLRWVADDAGLEVSDEAVAAAVRRGRGSARDALSALDQIVAAGGEVTGEAPIGEIVEGICESDVGRALAGVAAACSAGHDPRRLADVLLAEMRDAFLATVAPEVLSLPEDDHDAATDRGKRLGPAAAVRALEALGDAILAMREAADPRVVLEAAVVRVARTDLEVSPAALLERLVRLERAVHADGGADPRPRTQDEPRGGNQPQPPPPVAGPASSQSAGPAPARAALGAHRRSKAPAPAGGGDGREVADGADRQAAEAPSDPPVADRPAAPAPVAEERPAAAAVGAALTRDDLVAAWGDHLLGGMRPKLRALYSSGRFVALEGGVATFAVSGEGLRSKAETVRAEVEAVLSSHFGRPVTIALAVDAPHDEPGQADRPDDGESVDVTELADAPAPRDGVQRLTEAFPGAEVVEPPDQG